ncbi:MAG: hypothetical protein IPP57_08535 [Candidatus Obscuribacter sp.]|jgi:hypothetical protein|nr:hypothetical protein [Candidatus Obscuribacter sp.]MBK7840098.1 hypothetical protein [Candidatus Obscuribacter sp.]MBK9204069.1 hypothetical protein [Candidatus Obscuribacter sp.]MBK9770853.1 hypothetical protein [Candidatus Obscuribacter sp.]
MREITGGNLTGQSLMTHASKEPLQAIGALKYKLIVAFSFVFIFALELLSYNFFKRELVQSDKKACNSFSSPTFFQLLSKPPPLLTLPAPFFCHQRIEWQRFEKVGWLIAAAINN